MVEIVTVPRTINLNCTKCKTVELHKYIDVIRRRGVLDYSAEGKWKCTKCGRTITVEQAMRGE